MRLTIAFCLAATAVILDGGEQRTVEPARLSGVVAALLAEGRMTLIDIATGRELASYVTSHPPRYALTIGRLARATSGDEVFAVLPHGDVPIIGGIDSRTFVKREVGRLPSDTFPALAVGSRTGRLFAFRSVDASVVVVDPRTGESHTLLMFPNGREVYTGAVSPDERRIYVSYHGSSTGIDWFDLTDEGWRRGGYVTSHGGFALVGGTLLAATGDPEIAEVDATGRTVRTFDTALYRNHLMEFAVDSKRRTIYAVGSCGYAGGLSATPMAPSRTMSRRVLAPVGDYSVCGERISLAPDGTWVAVASLEDTFPQASRPGSVLIVDSRTGTVVQRLATSSDVVDVLAAR